MQQDSLLITPVAGCDEIGMNLMLYSYKKSCIMVDCGIGFPEQRIMPGVDISVPNLDFLKDQNIKIDALIITHAHEDHIGAICYLWEYLSGVTIYATPFAANLLFVKAIDFGIAEKLRVVQVTPNKPKFDVGSFSVEMVGLTHSVPEMAGLYIKGGKTKIFHTGDWKFDDQPVIGQTTQMERLAEIGSEGVSVLLCDSTNIFNKERTKSEGDLFESFCSLVDGYEGRVVVTIFASNVARIQTVWDVAKKTGRDLILSGTALHRIVGVAQKAGYLRDLEFLDMKEASAVPRKKALILATGCQGEPLGSVAKFSSHSHPLLKLSAGDRVIFSSRGLPMNIKKISNTINRFVRLGIDVITDKNVLTHVSGHPSFPEVKELYELLKPKIAIPVHGEALHLYEHCRLAREEFNVPFVHCINNGEILEIPASGEGVKKVGKLDLDFLGVDGYIFRSPGDNVMRERRTITQNGAICLSFGLDERGKMVVYPEVLSFGFAEDDDYDDLFAALKKDALAVVQEFSSTFGKSGPTKKLLGDLVAKIKQRMKPRIKNRTTKIPLTKICIHIV